MRILLTLLALLVALSLAGMTPVAAVCTCEDCDCTAAPYNCTQSGNFTAGTIISLDGEWTGYVLATDYGPNAVQTIEYLWTLWNASCPVACDSELSVTWNFVSGYKDNDSAIEFYAPFDPGCYIVRLTVENSIDIYKPGDVVSGEPVSGAVPILTLPDPCVAYNCTTFCVEEYECVNCSEIFCEEDCGDYLQTSTYCPDYVAADGGLCYPYAPSPTSVRVNWYIKDVAADFTVATFSNTDCIDPVWCDEGGMNDVYAPGTYEITMQVEGYDESTEVWTEIYKCVVGTVVIVEDPTATIS